MKVLFVSRRGKSLGLAERVKNEEHASSMYIVEKKSRVIGEGVVDKPQCLLPLATSSLHPIKTNINKLLAEVSPDLVVFDEAGLGRVADYIRNTTPVIGACWWADHATLDPVYGKKMMHQVGIKIREKEEGVAVESELWWDGLHSSIHNISFNQYRFMNDDVGSTVDYSNSVVKLVKSDNRIVLEGVGRMERLLKKTSYRGQVKLKGIVTKKGFYGTSLIVSFNYSSLQALFEIYKGSITTFLYSIATAANGYGKFTSDYSISVNLSIPPYPHALPNKDGVVIEGVDSGNMKHLWWEDVRKSLGGGYESAGVSGKLVTVVARGRYVEECRNRVYRTINNLSIKDAQYRTDVGRGVSESERILKGIGYLS